MSQKEKDIAIACVLVAFDLGRDGECDNSTLVKRVDEVIATIFEMSGTSSTKLSPSRTESRSGRTISGISTKQRGVQLRSPLLFEVAITLCNRTHVATKMHNAAVAAEAQPFLGWEKLKWLSPPFRGPLTFL